MPNKQRENANPIFTNENLEKSYKLADVLKDLTINNAKYESNSETTIEAQDDLTSDPSTVTHISNDK